jgi:hypothetical protein
MNSHETGLHGSTLEDVRHRLESEGYEFITAPNDSQLPSFLKGNRPDAIAKKGESGVVIQLTSRADTSLKSNLARFLAAEVPKHDGWRFEVYISKDTSDSLAKSADPEVAGLKDDLEDIESLIHQGNAKVAVPYAWGLLEGAARKLLFDEDAVTGKRYLPKTIVDRLVSEGYLDDKTASDIYSISRLRTWIVHGYTNVSIENGQLETLLVLVRRLITEIEKLKQTGGSD